MIEVQQTFAADLAEKIRTAQARVAVIGPGELGLPLATAFAQAGLAVIGLDVNGVDAGAMREMDVAIICVLTPYISAEQADMSGIDQAARLVAEHLHPAMLVVLESTAFPGTTAEVLKPRLEDRGLVCGVDFHLAYSSEQVHPATRQSTPRSTPKIVSGVTVEASELAAALYGHVAERVVRVATPREAEMMNLLKHSFHHGNRGLGYDMALMCGM